MSLHTNIRSGYSQMECDRGERHRRTLRRPLAVHQSSTNTDTFPQCHRLLAGNIYEVDMSSIASSGTWIAQVYISDYPLIINRGRESYMCIAECVYSTDSIRVYSISLKHSIFPLQSLWIGGIESIMLDLRTKRAQLT